VHYKDNNVWKTKEYRTHVRSSLDHVLCRNLLSPSDDLIKARRVCRVNDEAGLILS